MESKYEKYSYQRHRGGLGAVILIFLGIIFLLNNFGLLSWQVWGTIWRFWPLILVLIGLRIIMGHSRGSSLAILFVALVFMALIILFSVASNNPAFSSWLSNYLPWVPQVHSQQLPDPYQSDNSGSVWY